MQCANGPSRRLKQHIGPIAPIRPILCPIQPDRIPPRLNLAAGWRTIAMSLARSRVRLTL